MEIDAHQMSGTPDDGDQEHRGGISRRTALGLAASTAAGAVFAGWVGRAGTVLAGGPGVAPAAGRQVAAAAAGGFLRMIGDQVTSDFDPRSSVGTLGVFVRRNMFKTITAFDGTTGEMVPLFAAELPAQDPANPLVYTFKIAPDQVWHDGTPVTAGDVKYTMDWMLDEENGSLIAQILDVVDTVEAIDDETVQITLLRESGSLLERLSTVAPVPQAAAEAMGKDAFKIAPVGLGPFIFDEFVVDDQVTMNRWEDYPFEPKPVVGQARLSRIVEGSARVNALQGGQADLDLSVDPQLFPVLEGAGFTATVWDSAGYNAILLNTGKAPFDDLRVRQAVAHSINREEIATAVWNGLAVPQIGPFPTKHYMAADVVPLEHDPEKAAALLAEAGQEGVEIELMQGIYSTGLTMVAVLQAQLEAGGFKVNVKTGDANGLYQFVFDQTWTAFSIRGNTSILGDFADIHARWTSRQVFNNASDEELKPILDALVAADSIPASDAEGRLQAYADYQQLVVDQARVIFLVNTPVLTASTPELSGVTMGLNGLPLDLTGVSLAG